MPIASRSSSRRQAGSVRGGQPPQRPVAHPGLATVVDGPGLLVQSGPQGPGPGDRADPA
ncbi:hypothetical protein [Pseudonocardia sp. NPDC049635]|uniref:hypothetical protein n=1 Tax=Pseudonocardia sp. NPDC049635 TaxID=3155506 RepID=UPI003405655B